ncbi:MAG: hypothetical protein WBO09_05430 [Methylocystis silviterrae]|uniref:hypothetical protein n=1 Tax=Methylocystis silviterrae TaxID=2743612 RepID=UPI003BE2F8EC
MAQCDDPVAGQPYRYLYTLIAFTVWPVLTPFAAAYAESDPERRRLWRDHGLAAAVFSLVIALGSSDYDELEMQR